MLAWLSLLWSWFLLMTLPPLNAFQSFIDSLRSPFFTILLFLLAATPNRWLEQLFVLVRQYPFLSLVTVSLSLLIFGLCWFLFGTLWHALFSTLWWLLWYAPLWLGVLRVAWIVVRRFILRRLGWQVSLPSLYQSLQTQFYSTLQKMMLRHWFTTTVEPTTEDVV